MSVTMTTQAATEKEPVDYVNPLVGTESKIELSTGNNYPAIAMPWGMNWQDGRWMGIRVLGRQNSWLQANTPAQPLD